ncbi:MAG: hypothetical protein ACR5LG_10125 [Sodalis sp. (in: enterobacteria)]|uniref:hypothetical protein n=1 Tax=Sodalis sp. (in: enterobacteria) TaxID=1898979 RepID=UPI003F31E6BC
MMQLIDGLATCGLPVVLTAGPDKHEQEMVAHIISLCRGVKARQSGGAVIASSVGGGY